MRGLWVFSLLAACAVGPKIPIPTRAMVLPLYHAGTSHRFVQVIVKERAWYFLLDTGAGECAVTPKAAQAMGLLVTLGGAPIEGIAGAAEADSSVVPELQLGSLLMKRLPVRVVDLSSKVFTENPSLIAGYLGSDLLGRFQLGLDLAGGTVTLASPGSAALFPGEPVAIPLHRGSHETRLTVSIEAESTEVELDTGAEHSILFRDKTSLRGVPQETFLGGVGPGDLFTVEHAQAKELRLGLLRLAAVDLWVIDTPRSKGGLLGADILSHFFIDLDPNRDTLYLWPRPEINNAVDLRPPPPPKKPGPAMIIEGDF